MIYFEFFFVLESTENVEFKWKSFDPEVTVWNGWQRDIVRWRHLNDRDKMVLDSQPVREWFQLSSQSTWELECDGGKMCLCVHKRLPETVSERYSERKRYRGKPIELHFSVWNGKFIKCISAVVNNNSEGQCSTVYIVHHDSLVRAKASCERYPLKR